MKFDYEKMRELGAFVGIGWLLVGCTAIGCLIGWYLDKAFHTEPYLLIVFLLLGAGAGLVEMFRLVGKYLKGDRK